MIAQLSSKLVLNTRGNAASLNEQTMRRILLISNSQFLHVYGCNDHVTAHVANVLAVEHCWNLIEGSIRMGSLGNYMR